MDNENDSPNQPQEPGEGSPEIQTAEPINSPETTQPQPSNEFQEVKRELTGYEKATLRWTRVIVGVNVLTCIFIALQWHEMKSSSTDTHTLATAANTQAGKMGDMSDAADKIRKAAQDMVVQDQRIADNAQKSLEASNAQSKAALSATIAQGKESLQTTIRNAQDEERAWLTVSSFKLSEEPALNKPTSVTIGIVNTGRTPALDLINQTVLYAWPGEPPITKFSLPSNPVSEAILAPGTTNMTFNSDPLILTTDAQITAYTKKTTTLYVHALIRYSDTFKRPHWTRICAYHINGMPLDSFVYCTHGNEIDQEGQQGPN